jgi:hypothetical protein
VVLTALLVSAPNTVAHAKIKMMSVFMAL